MKFILEMIVDLFGGSLGLGLCVVMNNLKFKEIGKIFKKNNVMFVI